MSVQTLRELLDLAEDARRYSGEPPITMALSPAEQRLASHMLNGSTVIALEYALSMQPRLEAAELALASERTRREEAEKVIDRAIGTFGWSIAQHYRDKYPKDPK